MAICEFCGEEVAPGDIKKTDEGVNQHIFCSFDHRDLWLEKKRVASEPQEVVTKADIDALTVVEAEIAPETEPKEAAQPPSKPSAPAAKTPRKRQARKR